MLYPEIWLFSVPIQIWSTFLFICLCKIIWNIFAFMEQPVWFLFQHRCLRDFFLWRCGPTLAIGLHIPDPSRSHTTTQHNRQDSSGRVISSSQRPLPDNTQHSLQTDIHAPSGIRTHNFSRRATVDLRLSPVFHNRWAAARYRARASIIPGRERFCWSLSF